MRRRGRSGLGLAALLLVTGGGALAGCGAPTTPATPADRVGSWVAVPAGPLSARHDPATAWVGDRFVVVGGREDRPCPPAAACLRPRTPDLRDGAAFDPATGVWAPIAPAPVGVSGSATAVGGSTLYVRSTDVSEEDAPGVLLAWDAAQDRWSELPVPAGEHGDPVVVGERLVVVSTPYEEPAGPDLVLEPGASRWRPLPADPLGPLTGRAAVWDGERLVLSGVPRSGSDQRRRVATLDAGLTRWTAREERVDAEGGAVAVGDRWVFPSYSYDGMGGPTPYPSGNGQVVDPATGSVSAVPEPPRGRGAETEGEVVGGRVGLWRHLLDPETLRWTTVPALPAADERQAMGSAGGGRWLFAFGGDDGTGIRADGFLLTLP